MLILFTFPLHFYYKMPLFTYMLFLPVFLIFSRIHKIAKSDYWLRHVHLSASSWFYLQGKTFLTPYEKLQLFHS